MKITSPSEYINTIVYISLEKENNIEYGDLIYITGKFSTPSIQRNYMGFSYKEYLKTLKIHGTIQVSKYDVIENNYINIFKIFCNNLRTGIENKIYYIFEYDSITSNIITALVLGDTSKIDEDIYDNFKNASISHILAISGLHITYLILGITKAFNKIVGKKNSYIITILILIIYINITDFSPSILRASIMAIILYVSKLVYRKNDLLTTLAISCLIILIYNPYLITSVGFIYSYFGTIGIILFQKNILKILKSIFLKKTENFSKIRSNKNNKIRKILNKISKKNQIKIFKIFIKIIEISSVTLSASIMIIPISLYNFNTLSIYFLISNILVSIILNQIISLSYIIILISFLNLQLSIFISKYLETLIQILILISNIGNLPFSKIYLKTPKVYNILFIYTLAIIINYIFKIYNTKDIDFDTNIREIKKYNSITDTRVKNTIEVIKYKYREKKNEQIDNRTKNPIKRVVKNKISIIIKITLILCIINNILSVNNIIDNLQGNMYIHIVDIGQGDCTFIETPNKQTILIDGGGNIFGSFDVGLSTVVSYILDRGYTKIDYIMVSHFDTDHVRRNIIIIK